MTRRAPQTGKVLDPAWRQARGRKGGAAARATYERRRRERGERFATKGDAFAAGYRAGYRTAIAWWARKYRRELTAALKGRAA